MKSNFNILDAFTKQDVMSIFKQLQKSILVLGLTGTVIACDSKEGNLNSGEGTEPGPSVNSYNVTGKLGSITFNKEDTSFVFWRKEYGATAAEDKLVQAKISASTKAKGDVVSFENKLVTADNISRVSSSGNLAYFKDYNLGTAIYAEGRNIGKTPDGNNVLKDMRFSGTEDNLLINGATIQEVLAISNAQNVTWKLEGDKATGYGGKDKVYTLVVN